jgi:predicted alpha/beta hydrolase
MEKITITASDGYQLKALFSTSVSESSKTIIISSGTGIKKEYYINFAQYLVENDFNVLLFDYRGIGESAPKDLRLSEAYIHDWGLYDMNAALDFVVNEKGLTNVTWVGHSVGSQLIGFLEKQEHLKKVVSICAGSGYWAYFSYPLKITVWILWFIAVPILVKIYGYGSIKMIGWGEDLPKNVLLEWREWCKDKDYCKMFLQKKLQTNKFYDFKVPITSIYLSDDPITNYKTASSLLELYPNSKTELVKLNVKDYTNEKVGHIGVFRKKFSNTLWTVLLSYLEQ